MHPDSAQDHHQKDFMQHFFQGDANRDADLFHNAPAPPQQFQPMQVSMEVLESFMAMQDGGAGQGGLSQQPAPSPQALMEQQLRLNQLQQLQQLQNQIFQQQMELLSGQNTFMPMPPTPIDRQRDSQQFGLPTPGNSTELRPQQSTDFVSPMILHTNNAPMGQSMAQQAQHGHGHGHGHGGGVPDMQAFPSHHMLPTAPHSAPANLVFQTNPPLPLPGTDLDFDISPLTSPWLGAYNNNPASPSNTNSSAQPSQPSASSSTSTPGPARHKRPPVSSSGDESTAPAKPPRKRQPPSRTAPQRRTSQRGTRSANSTPLFAAGIPQDTPLRPPAPAPVLAPSSSVSPAPETISQQQSPITPVTPASIMNLGRLGLNSALAPARKEGHAKGKAAKGGEPAKSARTPSVPLVSPSLKPIRPAGNMAVMTATSPGGMTGAPPVVQFRKSSHKAAEQKRRDSLKTSFDDLRVLLPPIPLPSEDGYPDEPILPGAMPPRGPPKGNVEGPNRGVSKLQLLRCGNEYMKMLKGRVERRDEEIEMLRGEVARLRTFVAEETAQAGMVDLEHDIDAVEIANGGLFSRTHGGYGGMFAGEGDEADEEGG
ncbi:hypothetical protein B0H21DRAFT_738534 [Amylocystis lapponica]|nr:hypothetical protein B0H21DRAFT_738534 [Amylocystis lapponica]